MKFTAEFIQALFQCGLTKYRIAKISGLSKQYVGQIVNAKDGIIPWEKRENKESLLKEAKKLIENLDRYL